LQHSNHNLQNWLLLLSLTLIWGTSYILIKKGLIGFSPIEIGCLRLGISGLCSLPVAIFAWKSISKEKLFILLLIGIFGSGLPSFLFPLSMTKSESSVNGILNSLSPLWTVLVGYYLFKVHIPGKKLWGVAIGFLGALVLVLGKSSFHLKVDALYSFLPVIATFCYGMSTNITKQKLQNENPIYTTAIAMCMVGLPAFGCLFFTGAPAKIAGGQVWLSLAAVAALAVFGTLVAWILFYRLVQRTDALFAASVTYLVPIVAVSWGLRDGETLSLLQVAGMMLILTGVYFTTRPQQSR
jgi:drug/metabolite transporter (DMT)-like permease